MAMTNEDWKYVETKLAHIMGKAVLNCDGHKLTLELMQVGTFQNKIVFYVDGWMRGEWLLKDCEERRRFFRPVKSNVWSKRQKLKLNKIGKSMLKRFNIDLAATSTHYESFWANFKALKKHLIQNNEDITLIRGEYETEPVRQ